MVQIWSHQTIMGPFLDPFGTKFGPHLSLCSCILYTGLKMDPFRSKFGPTIYHLRNCDTLILPFDATQLHMHGV